MGAVRGHPRMVMPAGTTATMRQRYRSNGFDGQLPPRTHRAGKAWDGTLRYHPMLVCTEGVTGSIPAPPTHERAPGRTTRQGLSLAVWHRTSERHGASRCHEGSLTLVPGQRPGRALVTGSSMHLVEHRSPKRIGRRSQDRRVVGRPRPVCDCAGVDPARVRDLGSRPRSRRRGPRRAGPARRSPVYPRMARSRVPSFDQLIGACHTASAGIGSIRSPAPVRRDDVGLGVDAVRCPATRRTRSWSRPATTPVCPRKRPADRPASPARRGLAGPRQPQVSARPSGRALMVCRTRGTNRSRE